MPQGPPKSVAWRGDIRALGVEPWNGRWREGDKQGMMEVMKRIGLFGGSFNPVHHGHLIAARDAAAAFALEEVWLMPCANPPHKPALAPAADRAAMIDAAIRGDSTLRCCRVEIERGGRSYTIDTIEDLQRRHPGVQWSFVTGSDSLPELRTWRRIADLLERCEFVTLLRPGYPESGLTDAAIGLPAPWPGRLRARLAEGHAIGISSTEIRRRVAEGGSIRYLVPLPVEDYIHRRGLYQHHG